MRKNDWLVLCALSGALLLVFILSVLRQNAYASEILAPIPSQKPLAITVQRTHYLTPVSTVPYPKQKPNLFRPKTTHLLSFGETPRPVSKPIGKITDSLSSHDAALYKEIFSAQSKGLIDDADRLIGELSDLRLRGHVLYQRYMHPTAYRSSFSELEAWLHAYADHPGADKIYKLAQSRKPADYNRSLPKPAASKTRHGYLNIIFDDGKPYKSSKKRSRAQLDHMHQISREIRSLSAKGSPTAALKRLNRAQKDSTFDTAEYDRLRAHIARGYMLAGKLREAQKIAIDAAEQSGEKAYLAGWIGGLVSWRLKDYDIAAYLFELSASSSYGSNWTRAAGAYWASRSHMRSGNHAKVSPWLKVAAGYPRTFYGLIATRALGWDYDFNWDMPAYTKKYQDLLEGNPAVWRAEALVMANQNHLAEAELRQINAKGNPELKNAILAYVHYAGMPSFAMRLAESMQHPDGGLYDSAFYPLSPWRPATDFKVDRALVNAFIRQESRFNPYAESHSGATGLMQIMPTTAEYVVKKNPHLKKTNKHSLKDPQLNLEIGQNYIANLLSLNEVDDNLFSLAVAYNAGPGNLRRWKRKYSDTIDDPLLFVETIPASETRAFVERVLSNYWIYRQRLKQPTPSLDAVAGGHWPQYVRLDHIRHAYNTNQASPSIRYKVANSLKEIMN